MKKFVEDLKKLSGKERIKHVRDNIYGLDLNALYKRETLASLTIKHPDDESNVKILKILIKKGLNIHVSDTNGHALNCAINYSCKNTKTIQYILNFISDPLPLFSHILSDSFVKLLQLYLAKGFDINYRYEHKTLLDYAFGNTNDYLIDVLIRFGADINSVDEQGNTMLMVLLNKGGNEDRSSHISLMIEKGADINFVNCTNNRSILMKMVSLVDPFEVKYVEGLLKDKTFSNINLIDSQGLSALEYAVYNNMII